MFREGHRWAKVCVRCAIKSITGMQLCPRGPLVVEMKSLEVFSSVARSPDGLFKSSQPRHMQDVPFGLKGKNQVVIA